MMHACMLYIDVQLYDGQEPLYMLWRGTNLEADSRAIIAMEWVNLDWSLSMVIPSITLPVYQGMYTSAGKQIEKNLRGDVHIVCRQLRRCKL